MDGGISVESLPLSSLSTKCRQTLSSLLNSEKVIPADGPEKLRRDWRGLATLVNISAEVAAGMNQHADKTARILELWTQRRDNTNTIGTLLQYLQRIDRYDAYDDLKELESLGQLVDIRPTEQVNHKHVPLLEEPDNDFITFDDVQHGEPQLYHAYVLYAKEDKVFVDELLSRMRGLGFRICTEEELLPGHSTQYAAVSRLISERCHKIIMVYSPDFLESPANSFYIDYAQAVTIELKKPKIIPCMYRPCLLPSNLTFYHKLIYKPPGEAAFYNFWHRLSQSLEQVNLPRITDANSSCSSALQITEIKQHNTTDWFSPDAQTSFLALPSPTTKSTSLNSLHTLQDNLQTDDTRSLSNVSQVSEPSPNRKKVSGFKKIINTLKGKKHKDKKAIMVAN